LYRNPRAREAATPSAAAVVWTCRAPLHYHRSGAKREVETPPMTVLEIWELASYVVTAVGLPLAIVVFFYEQNKERENEEEAAYQQLSDAYTDFLKLVLESPDLKLRSQEATPGLNDEQRERMLLIFDMLVALFERAYLLIYEDDMSEKQRRRWHSWDDYMREWCRREDFRIALPELLSGEDPDFAAYIQGVSASSRQGEA
jgi:hypothetical protein